MAGPHTRGGVGGSVVGEAGLGGTAITPPPDSSPIAVRAYSVPARTGQPIGPSEFVLVFDTETTIDAAQQLRLGAYQFREKSQLKEAGVFYDAESLTEADLNVVRAYAASNDLEVRTDRQFVDEVLFA